VPADLEVQLDLVGVGIAHLGDLLSAGHRLTFLDQDVAVVRIGGEEGPVVLDDDELAVAAQSGSRVDDLAPGAGDDGCSGGAAMSMPFRFEVSEEPLTSLPFAGHTHSIFSSPSSPSVPAVDLGSERTTGAGGTASAGAGGGAPTDDGAAALGVAAIGATVVGAVAVAAAAGGATATRCISRSACSEYGSLRAFGCSL
jgi:hypothetical protein